MAHDDVALYRLAEVCFMFSHRFSKTGLPQENCLLLVRLRYITYIEPIGHIGPITSHWHQELYLKQCSMSATRLERFAGGKLVLLSTSSGASRFAGNFIPPLRALALSLATRFLYFLRALRRRSCCCLSPLQTCPLLCGCFAFLLDVLNHTLSLYCKH